MESKFRHSVVMAMAKYHILTYLFCYRKHYSQNDIVSQMQLNGVDIWH